MASRRATRPAPGADGVATAALNAFYRYGYHGTSVRDIASGAGVTVAALYYHFASKQDILLYVLRQAMEATVDTIRAARDSGRPEPAFQLAAMMRAHVLYHTEHHVEAFVGNNELRSLDGAARRSVVQLRDEVEAIFREVVNAGVHDGSFATAATTDETVRALLAMTIHVAAWYQPGPLTPSEIADRYEALALQLVGYRKRPSRRTAVGGPGVHEASALGRGARSVQRSFGDRPG
jgi:AcrR family transcriptional regulator